MKQAIATILSCMMVLSSLQGFAAPDLLPNIGVTPIPRPARPIILAPSTPINPTKPGNDPWLPLPVPGGFDPICYQRPSDPICRNGGINIPAPGTPGPRDGNGRPAIYVANVPAEYDCPLFENNPYEALNQAIDSLSYAMTTVPECASQKTTLDNIEANNKAIRESIRALRVMMAGQGPGPTIPQDPNMPQDPSQQPLPLPNQTAGAAAMEANVQLAIQAANNLGQIFSSNPLLNSRCGREVMSTGKVMLALNDILNGLAPYALAAVAINPAIGGAAKLAITGGAIASSSISAIVKMIEQGTVDMNNPEHRKAVLKNTCQYTKISRKVRFLQLAQSGQIETLTNELEQKVEQYKAQYSVRSKDLQEIISYQSSMDAIADAVETQIKKDTFNLSFIVQQMKEAGSDDQYTCMIANEMLSRARAGANPPGGFNPSAAVVFPDSIGANLRQAVEFTQQGDNMQATTLMRLNFAAKQRLAALEPRVLNDEIESIKLCAQTSRTMINGLIQMVNMTKTLINGERASLEQELGKNPEYAAWRNQYRLIQQEQTTASRVGRVMAEMSKDNSVLARNELDQRMTLLKSALFGLRGSWSLGRSPVMEWLEHTMRLHANRISSFSDNISRLQSAAYELARSGAIDTRKKMTYAQMDATEVQNNRAAMALETITADRVKLGTPGHELACQVLETAWLDWSAAIDYLNGARFMCDMIYPYLDNKVETKLVKFCRGDMTFDGRQLEMSRLQDAAAKLTKTVQSDAKTYEQWSVLLGKKMKQIQCKMPSVSSMN